MYKRQRLAIYTSVVSKNARENTLIDISLKMFPHRDILNKLNFGGQNSRPKIQDQKVIGDLSRLFLKL